MIDERSLEQKDFSGTLPEISDRLGLMIDLAFAQEEGVELLEGTLRGMKYVLEDIKRDIDVIDRTLYPIEEDDQEGGA